ncbi:MAG: sugar phosphate isomerase/epimerase [Clostridia bacterium]|nr:sugar phosphate isomerase/epimerase [Clostridia bacterium]
MIKTALQLYSVRATLLGDLKGHLKEIRAMGYEGAEYVNFGGDSVERIAEEMGNAGLEVFSIHTDINEMIRMDEAQLIRYKELGCRYMPIGWLPEDRLAGGPLYSETLDTIKAYSALAKKHGIQLLYHNHDFDFVMAGDRHRLDVLYADTDAEVLGAELDTCWIYSGGEDPLAYMKKYTGRCPVLHLKDCVKEGGRSGFRALGEGVLDFAPIVSAAESLGVKWLCVEQDEPSPDRTPMECAKMSMEHLKALLK